jgi:hypothetical protein
LLSLATAAPLPDRFESTISAGHDAQSRRNGAFSLATRIAGAPAARREPPTFSATTAGSVSPSVCALFPTTHIVLKSLGWTAKPRLSFKRMQAYIVV